MRPHCVLVVLFLAACGDDASTLPDAPFVPIPDARWADARPPDAQSADAAPDAESADAAPDAQSADAAPDAQSADAAPDASLPDASAPDASIDASGTDAAPTICFAFALSGAEEVPPITTAATGSGMVTINPATNSLSYAISFTGLSSTESAAHIHGFASVGVEAGVLFALPIGSPKFGTVTYSDSQEADILAGLTYVNIHSGNFPDGEIRGQIDEPTTCP